MMTEKQGNDSNAPRRRQAGPELMSRTRGHGGEPAGQGAEPHHLALAPGTTSFEAKASVETRLSQRSGEWRSPHVPAPARTAWYAWLGVGSSARADARWARQVTSTHVHVLPSARALLEPRTGRPLACIIEYELGKSDGIDALRSLQEGGLFAPTVLIATDPASILERLTAACPTETVPVFSRKQRYERLREWFEQLRICWATG